MMEAECHRGKRFAGVCNVPRKQNMFAGYCFNMTKQQVDEWPSISFKLGKGDDQIDIEFSPDVYLTPGACGDPTSMSLDLFSTPPQDSLPRTDTARGCLCCWCFAMMRECDG